MRTLPPGLAALISQTGQQPALSLILHDAASRASTIAAGGTAGRTAALLTSAGTLLIARVTQGADPNTLAVARVINPAQAGQWSAYTAIATVAQARAGCALARSGSTIRLFYQRTSDHCIAYRDSTDDGQSWSAEQALNSTLPNGDQFCYGIAAADTSNVLVAYAFYDPTGVCALYLSQYTTAWSALASVGPTLPSWGYLRGLSLINQSGYKLAAGVQTKAGLTGIAAATTTSASLAAGSYSAFATVRPMDNPGLGLSLAYPNLHYDGASGTYYLAVCAADDGSVSGSAHTRSTILQSTDFTTWTPIVSLGSVFQFGAHALKIAGTLYAFDGASCYTVPAGPSPTDASNDVIDISIAEQASAPAKVSITLANQNGQYLQDSNLRTDAQITLALGYGDQLVTTHVLLIDALTFQVNDVVNEVVIQARDKGKLLDYPASQLHAYSGQTVSAIAQAICGLAGLPIAALPATPQFSQTIPCFQIAPGETWLAALLRLSAVYSSDFRADATGTLVFIERATTDPSTWTYGPEILAASISSNADQANVIRVIGASSSGQAVWAEQLDGQNLLAISGERYRQIVDRLLDTSARCLTKAQLALHDEQAAATAVQLLVPLNPQLEVDDVITFTDAAIGVTGKAVRIHAIHTAINPGAGAFTQHLACTGV